jgi:hypothetical protein
VAKTDRKGVHGLVEAVQADLKVETLLVFVCARDLLAVAVSGTCWKLLFLFPSLFARFLLIHKDQCTHNASFDAWTFRA